MHKTKPTILIANLGCCLFMQTADAAPVRVTDAQGNTVECDVVNGQYQNCAIVKPQTAASAPQPAQRKQITDAQGNTVECDVVNGQYQNCAIVKPQTAAPAPQPAQRKQITDAQGNTVECDVINGQYQNCAIVQTQIAASAPQTPKRVQITDAQGNTVECDLINGQYQNCAMVQTQIAASAPPTPERKQITDAQGNTVECDVLNGQYQNCAMVQTNASTPIMTQESPKVTDSAPATDASLSLSSTSFERLSQIIQEDKPKSRPFRDFFRRLSKGFGDESVEDGFNMYYGGGYQGYFNSDLHVPNMFAAFGYAWRNFGIAADFDIGLNGCYCEEGDEECECTEAQENATIPVTMQLMFKYLYPKNSWQYYLGVGGGFGHIKDSYGTIKIQTGFTYFFYRIFGIGMHVQYIALVGSNTEHAFGANFAIEMKWPMTCRVGTCESSSDSSYEYEPSPTYEVPQINIPTPRHKKSKKSGSHSTTSQHTSSFSHSSSSSTSQSSQPDCKVYACKTWHSHDRSYHECLAKNEARKETHRICENSCDKTYKKHHEAQNCKKKCRLEHEDCTSWVRLRGQLQCPERCR